MKHIVSNLSRNLRVVTCRNNQRRAVHESMVMICKVIFLGRDLYPYSSHILNLILLRMVL